MGRFAPATSLPAVVVLALAFAGTQARAAGEKIGFEPSYWDETLDGTVRADGTTLDGTEVDLQEGLGLEAGDKHPAGVFWIRWLKRNSLAFSMTHSERNGDQVLTAPLIFNDQAFLPGDRVESHVETDLKSLVYGFNFVNTRLFQMGLRAGVDRLGLDATVESGTLPTRAAADVSATYPVLGLNLWFEPVPFLRFVAELDGSTGTLHGNDVSFYDGRVQAEIYWWRFFAITAGYRRVKMDAEMEDFGGADLNQKGPYAGFVFRF